MTQGNVPILVDHRRYGIRTTRRTIAGKTQTGTAAHEERTDDRCHERLVVKQRRHANRMRLYQTGGKGKDTNTIDGLQTELIAQNAECDEKQEHIERQIRHRCRDAKSPAKDRSDTSYTTHRDMIGKQEDVQTDTTFYHRQGNDNVVADFMKFCFSRHINIRIS